MGQQRGQAILEYVLLLVVVIMLATLLATRIFKPVQKWMEFYIGSYVECLLDQGELPGQGGTSGVQDCEFVSPFEDHDNQSSGAAGKNGNKGKEGGKKSNSDSDGKSSDSGHGGTVITNRNGDQHTTRIGGLDNSAGDGKTTTVADPTKGDSGSGYLKITRAGGGVRYDLRKNTRVSGLAGMMAAERDKIKRREDKIVKLASSSEEGEGGRLSRKIPIKAEQKKAKVSDFTVEEFSFGKVFRILMIIAIAIALILFVGGQLAQISKSMEK